MQFLPSLNNVFVSTGVLDVIIDACLLIFIRLKKKDFGDFSVNVTVAAAVGDRDLDLKLLITFLLFCLSLVVLRLTLVLWL